MKRKSKILILGIGQSNFLNQLYGSIREETKRFEFSIEGYYDISRGVNEEENLPYTKFYNFQIGKISSWNRLKSFIKFAFKPLFYGIILFESSQKTSPKKIYEKLKGLSIQKYKAENLISPLGYDIYHCHFCIPENLMQLYFLPKNSKILCSFWGSDLMRRTGVSNVYYVKKVLKRATKITVQTQEMAEMFYCKYGREFNGKIEVLRFTLDKRIFDVVDFYRNNPKGDKLFRSRFNLPAHKIVIGLGHNAFPENNHIKMIEQLKFVQEDILNSCIFLLHLGYGGNSDYIEKLRALAEREKQMAIIIIEEFLGYKEMALLRSQTNILIHMPVSDALSSAMTEVLYAGNIVIAGAWLPFGVLRRNGIQHFEAESFQDLPEIVEKVYLVSDKCKKKNENNAVAIREFLFPEKTTPQWIKLFDLLS